MWKSRHELTETEEKIVGVLAEKGAKTYYDIYKKEKICSASTAWNLMKSLEKYNFIEVKKEEAFRIRGRKKKFYGLTLKGLSVALRKRQGWEKIDSIAKQQERLLPLIFSKWQHFKKYCDSKYMTDALRNVMLLNFPMLDLRAKNFGWRESTLVNLSIREFGLYILRLMPEERICWLKAIHDDDELRTWMLGIEKIYLQYFEAITLSFNVLREKEPNWDEVFEKLSILMKSDE